MKSTTLDPSSLAHTLGAAACTPLGECHFGDPEREAAQALAGTVVVPLFQLGFIAATGADAATFLQGQLSNDVRRVDADRAQLSSLNSPKGRLLAVLHLLRADDAFLLELHRSVLGPVLSRLRMYVLRSKVTLAESSHFAFGVAGPGTADVLRTLQLPLPDEVMQCAWRRGRGVVRRHGAVTRCAVIVPADAVAATWETLREQAPPAGTRAWRLLDVLAGLPTVYAETQDHFVPQMCNLDELGGISFDKGCYTGQEIVARVHYRGAVKRRMSLLRTQDLGQLPGARIDIPGGGRGEVVDSAPHPDGGTAALVVSAEG